MLHDSIKNLTNQPEIVVGHFPTLSELKGVLEGLYYLPFYQM